MLTARSRLPMFLLCLLCLLPALTGCGAAAAPTVAYHGGDLVIHHQLENFKLMAGTRIMFRDEAVFRFTLNPASGELSLSHDPKTQLGSERLHAFMRLPATPMPAVQCTWVQHPPELPAADRACRVQVHSHWWHEFMGQVEVDTEYLVAPAPGGGVLFQPVTAESTQLADTSYSWANAATVLPLNAAGETAPEANQRLAEVGEFAAESRERVEFLQAEVPALGDAWRSALIDLADE